MAQRHVPQWVKSALELGPVIGFFVAYLWVKDEVFTFGGTEYDGFIVATAVFIPVILASMGLLWWLTGHISRMQIVTAVLVVVFGGLTVWLNDDRFIKMKPTMVYSLLGGILAVGLLRNQSYLRVVMGELLPMEQEGWMILTKRMTGFFFLLAISNEIIWRTQSTETWVYFETFVLTGATFVFFIAQAGVIQKYSTAEED
ncbi:MULTISPECIES: inner membrane-spanning protein YciB [Marivita]|uniref:Inner membrane-spanning protein YciB n=1 Tax=Marivita cryptomonadis TaxID=505252 RepID=A0A9Q2NSM6_9RHOB|nr:MULTISPECIES: inner membrane-spanning protein YciB [Marivita]MBM2320455.1 septation protein IspZ [Marivita cryptomonadis]MBM2330035.1 septation protein IspZ [Marivita cryptomonadis]MBM2339622.1 septation protein IspZ [Marivita cryptomonadis]MBM2344281.1 septation protein IspZ [Marivita cryptomonadis]MBM2348959.1 septation protein IspZ [Marivita cryptomonadis]